MYAKKVRIPCVLAESVSRDLFNVHNYICFSQGFFAYSALNINFKGVHMKLKIVGLEISVK